MEQENKKITRKYISRDTPTVSEVARCAKVSQITVSRVFNGSIIVSDTTREKVLKAAREVGYHPNKAARVLRTGRSNLVGLLTNSYETLGGEFYSEAFVALQSVLSTRHLDVMISIVPPVQSLAYHAKHLIATSRCEAIALRYDPITESDYKELVNFQTPIVLINFNSVLEKSPYELASVGFDNIHGIEQAVRYLASQGHQRIAYLGGNHGWVDSIQREMGFRSGMRQNGLTVNEDWIQECVFGVGCYNLAIEKTTHILTGSIPNPTAIVCACDEFAVGAISAAGRLGKSIPKDISVIGFGDRTWSPYLTPSLTTLQHPGRELGEKVGRYMLEFIENPNTHRRNTVLETHLIIRDSTGIAPKQ